MIRKNKQKGKGIFRSGLKEKNKRGQIDRLGSSTGIESIPAVAVKAGLLRNGDGL